MSADAAREAERQRVLLQAVQGDAGALAAWLRTAPARQARALQAYQAHAGAQAERALAAAYPTVQLVVGGETLAALARRYGRHAPAARGDLAEWGATLPSFLRADAALADEPYLPDLARVDWAVHRAQTAVDAAPDPASLRRLAEEDAAGLTLKPAPGAALVDSRHPVATIWRAHRSAAADRFAPARAALAAAQAEAALVWRRGWRVAVAAVAPADTAFVQAWLAGEALGAALDQADAAFDFGPWLQRAVGEGWLLGVCDA